MSKEASCYFDARWIAPHGIGRFAKEMSSSRFLINNGDNLLGCFDDIFSKFDPIRLSWKMTFSDSWFVSPSYNCPLLFSGRTILTIHDLMHINFSGYVSIRNKLYYEFLVKKACRKSPLIFTVSEFSKSEICRWANVAPEKVVVIYNGVGEGFCRGIQPMVREKPYFLYIGDKKGHKNIEGMLEAFSESNLCGQYELLFSGISNEMLAKKAEYLGVEGSVKFTGFIHEEDLASVYRGATALLLPSFYEGFGLPIIEAMAVGTPVLTSNITAMPEVAGGAALLVNPYDVGDIARGMQRIVSDMALRESLIEMGFERAKLFNWDAAREKWDAALSSATGLV